MRHDLAGIVGVQRTPMPHQRLKCVELDATGMRTARFARVPPSCAWVLEILRIPASQNYSSVPARGHRPIQHSNRQVPGGGIANRILITLIFASVGLHVCSSRRASICNSRKSKPASSSTSGVGAMTKAQMLMTMAQGIDRMTDIAVGAR